METEKSEFMKKMEQSGQAVSGQVSDAQELTEKEKEEIRKTIANSAMQREMDVNRKFVAPPLEITDADRDAFAEAILSNTPYKENFERFKGKLSVTLRVKMQPEVDAVLRQLQKDIQENRITSSAAYVMQVSYYNMLFQVCKIDGKDCVAPSPSSDLRSFLESSQFMSMPDPKVYLILNFLAQFDDKVLRLNQEALSPNFTSPVAAS